MYSIFRTLVAVWLLLPGAVSGSTTSVNCAGSTTYIPDGTSYQDDVLLTGACILNGRLTVAGSLTVSGSLTHDRTSDRNYGVLITVLGALIIPRFGSINVNEKSQYTYNGNPYLGAYGGSTVSGPLGYMYGSGGYGDFQTPQELGSWYSYQFTNYAGGRVKITASSAQINGTITARGNGCGSGGSINIDITNGGSITGTGSIDVSVSPYQNYWYGSGGRVAISGYSTLSTTIAKNVVLDGGSFGGCGTAFFRSVLDTTGGSLSVNCVIQTTVPTPITFSGSLHRLSVSNANLQMTINSDLNIGSINGKIINAAVNFMSSTYGVNILAGGLSLVTTTCITCGFFSEFKVQNSLLVYGNTSIDTGSVLNVGYAINVYGSLNVEGQLYGPGAGQHTGGAIMVRDMLTFAQSTTVTTRIESGSLSLTVSSTGLLCTVIFTGYFTTTGDVNIANGATLKLAKNDLSASNGGILGASVVGSVFIAPTGTLILNGALSIATNLIVFGLFTHDQTSDVTRGLVVTVMGKLSVEVGGRINADQKSSYYSVGQYYLGSYGGSTQAGPLSYMYASSGYGNFQSPEELGTWYNYQVTNYAGGRIKITAGSMDLYGEISARGLGCGSGGSINIAFLSGGTLNGTGVIDVSVMISQYNYGAGGRVAITGFASLSPVVLSKLKLDGQILAGCGTAFLRSETDRYGGLHVVSTNPAPINGGSSNPNTYITFSGNLDWIKTMNSFLYIQHSSSSMTVGTVNPLVNSVIQFNTGTSTYNVYILREPLTLTQSSKFVVSYSLTIYSTSTSSISLDSTLIVNQGLLVFGSLNVTGVMSGISSKLAVTGQFFTNAVSLTINARVEVGVLQCRGGLLTINGYFVSSSDLIVSATAFQNPINVLKFIGGYGALIRGSLSVLTSATLILNGAMTVLNNLYVTGVVTHDVTTDRNLAILFTVGGAILVEAAGRIHADLKSSYCGSGSCSGFGAYGGSTVGSSGYGGNTAYGDFMSPGDLGAYFSPYGHYGGGRIQITASSLDLNGTISAKGQGAASGGTVNIVLTGGVITGTGFLDVSVQFQPGSLNSGGGGRISVVGYRRLPLEIYENIALAGSLSSGGCGTLFLKSAYDDLGGLYIFAPTFSNTNTPINLVGSLAYFVAINSMVTLQQPTTFSIVTVGTLRNSVVVFEQGTLLTIQSVLYVAQSTFNVFASLIVTGSLYVSTGSTFTSYTNVQVYGEMTVEGRVIRPNGGTGSWNIQGNLLMKYANSMNCPISANKLDVVGVRFQIQSSYTLTTVQDVTISENGILQLSAQKNGFIGGSLYVTAGSTLISNGICKITQNVFVNGTITHDLTSDVNSALVLIIKGNLNVGFGGQISVDRKSEYYYTSPSYYGAYGGDTVGNCYNPGTSYGDYSNPAELGSYFSPYGHYAGGRITIMAASVLLNGNISAKGYGGSSGGSINIACSGGGAFAGSGFLDVSVDQFSYSCVNYGAGGRIAVTGFTFVAPVIINQTRTDGAKHQSNGQGGGCGTAFFRSTTELFGGLRVVCSNQLSPGNSPVTTTINNYQNLDWLSVSNAYLNSYLQIDIVIGSFRDNFHNSRIYFYSGTYGVTVLRNGLTLTADTGYSCYFYSQKIFTITGNVFIADLTTFLVPSGNIKVYGAFNIVGTLSNPGSAGSMLVTKAFTIQQTPRSGTISWPGNSLWSVGSFELNASTTNLPIVDIWGFLQVTNGALIVGDNAKIRIRRGAYVFGSVVVNRLGMMYVNGYNNPPVGLTVANQMTIFGKVSHELTASFNEGLFLTVFGELAIAASGEINVNEMSNYAYYNYQYSGGYGAQCGPAVYSSVMYVGSPYGAFDNPVEMGSYYSHYWTNYAGGRVSIESGSMVLNGTISSRGVGGASGGAIKIIINGGLLSGNGIIDVSVALNPNTQNSNGNQQGSGGRVAITGFSFSSFPWININLNGGISSNGGGVGTLFYKSAFNPYGSIFLQQMAILVNPGSGVSSGRNTDIFSGTSPGCSGCGTKLICNMTSINAPISSSSSYNVRFCGTCAPSNGQGACYSGSNCLSCSDIPFCADGSFWNVASGVNGACEVCPLGFFCKRSSKMSCPFNSYQDVMNSSSCVSCPAFSQNTVYNSRSVKACICNLGLYLDNSINNTTNATTWFCSACPSGNSCSDNLKTACQVGFYQNDTSQGSCIECPLRSTTSFNMSTMLFDCLCTPGYYMAAGACVPCDIGYQCLNNTRRPCGRDFYQSKIASSSCTACASDRFSNATAAISSNVCSCSDGFFTVSNASSLSPCIPCLPGRYCVKGIMTYCPLDQYQPLYGQTSCQLCNSVVQASGTSCYATIFAIKDCPAFVAPPNGYVIPSPFSSTTVYVACNEGFVLSGNSISSCSASVALWSNTEAVCTANFCNGTLVPPANGTVSSSGSVTRSDVSYQCNQGWTLDGASAAICLSSGDWSSNTPPICRVSSCPPLMIYQGTVPEIKGSTLDVVEIACNEGFQASVNSSMCLTTGQWSQTPVCYLKPCGSLMIPGNGSLSAPGGVYNETVQKFCNSGFTIVGDVSTVCLITGNWSKTTATKCSPNSCLNLTPLEHGTAPSLAGKTYDVVQFACNSGWVLAGTYKMACQPSGLWFPEQPPVCEPLACIPMLAPANGNVTMGGMGTTSSVIMFACNQGWTAVGSTNATCQSDGSWTMAPTCRANSCGTVSDVPNGTASPLEGFTLDTVTYTCNQGYTLSGSSRRVCNIDGWNNPAANCVADACPSLSSISNGFLSSTVTVFVTDSVTYTCNSGYNLFGTATTQCMADKTWSSTAPNCVLFNCASLAEVLHGTLSVSGQTANSIIYSCDNGFTINGPSTTTCLDTGLWTSVSTTCDAILCLSSPRVPANGVVSTMVGRTGDSLAYTCNQGYRNDGAATATCAGSGAWLPETTCVPAPCLTSLTPPSHGTVDKSTGTSGEQATYACHQGYSLVGSSQSVCQIFGNWTTVAPICKPQSCSTTFSAFPGTGTTGMTYLLQCPAGLAISGVYGGAVTNEFLCQSDGYWSPTPSAQTTCQPLTCPTISIPFSVGGGSYSTEYPNVMDVVCQTGYFVDGVFDVSFSQISCIAQNASSVRWSAIPTCSVAICAQQVLTHSLMTELKGNLYDSRFITCAEGYGIMGTNISSASFRCSAGGLSTIWITSVNNLVFAPGSQPCQPAPCPAMTVPVGGTSAVLRGHVFDVVRVGCQGNLGVAASQAWITATCNLPVGGYRATGVWTVVSYGLYEDACGPYQGPITTPAMATPSPTPAGPVTPPTPTPTPTPTPETVAPVVTGASGATAEKSSMTTIIAVGIGSALLIISLVLFVIAARKRSKSNLSASTGQLSFRNDRGQVHPMSQVYQNPIFESDASLKIADLTAVSPQKPGHYGACAQGLYTGKTAGSNNKTEDKVAILYLTKSTLRAEFQTEVKLLTALSKMNPSPYIVSILGVCNVGVSSCMVVGWASQGTLLGHLKELKKKQPSHGYENIGSMLMKFTIQVARGMLFLENRKISHSNLQCKNVLLDDSWVCKLNGIGRKATGLESVRWQAPEFDLAQAGDHDIRSDVWSFGVTVWEIFSLGDQPFTVKLATDVRAEVGRLLAANAIVLENPIHCSAKDFTVLASCLTAEVGARPRFKDIVALFNSANNIYSTSTSPINYNIGSVAQFYAVPAKEYLDVVGNPPIPMKEKSSSAASGSLDRASLQISGVSPSGGAKIISNRHPEQGNTLSLPGAVGTEIGGKEYYEIPTEFPSLASNVTKTNPLFNSEENEGYAYLEGLSNFSEPNNFPKIIKEERDTITYDNPDFSPPAGKFVARPSMTAMAASMATVSKKVTELPKGWRQAHSQSRPGDFSYENIHTKERQSERPNEDALTFAQQKQRKENPKKIHAMIPDPEQYLDVDAAVDERWSDPLHYGDVGEYGLFRPPLE